MNMQQKYPYHDGIIKDLSAKGVIFGADTPHVYTYFSVPNDQEEKSILRLKSSEGVNNLDYKTRKEKSGEWERYGTDIIEADQLRLILKKIGIKELKTFKKTFKTWMNDFLRIDIVTVDDAFSVLEAKFQANDSEKVKLFLTDLGIDTSKPDNRSVIEIYYEMKRKGVA